ncbi:MAG TPA: ammonia channel protein, partial [Alphaproteobacteria bacterium]|nr:ammonia channel protein [Alphaproteobacteria bacterium]
ARFKIDDSLDVLAVHGVGGATGILMAAVFASTEYGGLGLAEGMTIGSQFTVQAVGVIATLVWSAVVSYIIIKVVAAVVGLSVGENEELEGLDITVHGEKGYEL